MSGLIAKKIINDKEFQIYKLNASEGIVVGTKLFKVILPVLGGFADEMFAEEDKDSPKTFSEMAVRILQQMDNIDILSLIKKLLDGMSVGRQDINFDDYFMGNYGELVLVVEFALRENFSSFFEGTGLKTRFFQAIGAMTGTQAESEEQ